jgi:hypothetical protein
MTWHVYLKSTFMLFYTDAMSKSRKAHIMIAAGASIFAVFLLALAACLLIWARRKK